MVSLIPRDALFGSCQESNLLLAGKLFFAGFFFRKPTLGPKRFGMAVFAIFRAAHAVRAAVSAFAAWAELFAGFF